MPVSYYDPKSCFCGEFGQNMFSGLDAIAGSGNTDRNTEMFQQICLCSGNPIKGIYN